MPSEPSHSMHPDEPQRHVHDVPQPQAVGDGAGPLNFMWLNPGVGFGEKHGEVAGRRFTAKA